MPFAAQNEEFHTIEPAGNYRNVADPLHSRLTEKLYSFKN